MTNSARLLRLARTAKLQSDNVTIWTGVNADLGNPTLWCSGFVDGDRVAQLDGYHSSQSKAIAELETVLADTEKIALACSNQSNPFNEALELAAELARNRGEHELSKTILNLKR